MQNGKSERMKAAFAALMADLRSGRPIRHAGEYLGNVGADQDDPFDLERNGGDRRHDMPLGRPRKSPDVRDERSKLEAEAKLEKLREEAAKGLPPLSAQAMAVFNRGRHADQN